VIVRLFNTVGPRQSGEYGNVVPRFVRAALAGAPLEVHGDGTQTRCFCHVRDTVHALADVVERGDTWGEIFNVGSTEPVTILQLAERVKALTGSASELVFVPYDQVYGQGIEEMFQRIPATDKIRAAIGWEPTITLDETLAEVVEHTRRTAPREPAPAP
jgi:UDP-glucose 4-epimerase